RGFLIGGPIGAVIVSGLKTFFTGAFADWWLFVLGGLFVFVTLYLPGGVFGLLRDGWRRGRGGGS
ncbi:MAG TPA: urea ABC transporter permease subunit UrtC, partial [Pseudomonadales bacterium]|nr:urea ABC transporter permease subunit UrtC [Pseudomonadales bacterium]